MSLDLRMTVFSLLLLLLPTLPSAFAGPDKEKFYVEIEAEPFLQESLGSAELMDPRELRTLVHRLQKRCLEFHRAYFSFIDDRRERGYEVEDACGSNRFAEFSEELSAMKTFIDPAYRECLGIFKKRSADWIRVQEQCSDSYRSSRLRAAVIDPLFAECEKIHGLVNIDSDHLGACIEPETLAQVHRNSYEN